MKHLSLSQNRLSRILKSYSSLKKGAYPRCGTVASDMQEEILFHLLTMTFIARQLGWKVLLNVSGKEL